MWVIGARSAMLEDGNKQIPRSQFSSVASCVLSCLSEVRLFVIQHLAHGFLVTYVYFWIGKRGKRNGLWCIEDLVKTCNASLTGTLRCDKSLSGVRMSPIKYLAEHGFAHRAVEVKFFRSYPEPFRQYIP